MTTDLDDRTKNIANLKMENMKKFCDFMKNEDPHIVTLFYWINSIGKLVDDIRITGMDIEIEVELKKIATRWTDELGIRVFQVMTKHFCILPEDLGV